MHLSSDAALIPICTPETPRQPIGTWLAVRTKYLLLPDRTELASIPDPTNCASLSEWCSGLSTKNEIVASSTLSGNSTLLSYDISLGLHPLIATRSIASINRFFISRLVCLLEGPPVLSRTGLLVPGGSRFVATASTLTRVCASAQDPPCREASASRSSAPGRRTSQHRWQQRLPWCR